MNEHLIVIINYDLIVCADRERDAGNTVGREVVNAFIAMMAAQTFTRTTMTRIIIVTVIQGIAHNYMIQFI